MFFRLLIVAAAAVLFVAGRAEAGRLLLASPPRNEAELRYEGTVELISYDAFGGSESFSYDRQLTIRTFGPELADRDGASVDAWWVEFEVETGFAAERGI